MTGSSTTTGGMFTPLPEGRVRASEAHEGAHTSTFTAIAVEKLQNFLLFLRAVGILLLL